MVLEFSLKYFISNEDMDEENMQNLIINLPK